MKYYFYILSSDAGFAPNPFYKFCTLATCKPKIRKKAEIGDWIIGFYSRSKNTSTKYRSKLIYVMKVTEKISFDEYWKNKRFAQKKANSKPTKKRHGDNIYYKNSQGKIIQGKAFFHKNKENREHDIKGESVLISDYFFYFGKKSINLSEDFKKLVNQLSRGYKYKELEKKGNKLINFLQKEYKNNKLYGKPIDYICEKIK